MADKKHHQAIFADQKDINRNSGQYFGLKIESKDC